MCLTFSTTARRLYHLLILLPISLIDYFCQYIWHNGKYTKDEIYRFIRYDIVQLETQAYDYGCDQIANIKTLFGTKWDDILYKTGSLSDSHLPCTFHLFPSFPTEIRLQIWQYALPGPRVIEIRTNHNLPSCTPYAFRALYPRSICRIPTMLHVCRESRAVALKRYELSLGLKKALRAGKGIYVDFEEDIVLFGEKSAFWGMQVAIECGEGTGLEKVRRLALGNGRGRYSRVHSIHFDGLKQLRELIFVAQTSGERVFDLGKEPRLTIFKVKDWNTKLKEMGAFDVRKRARALLEKADRRRRAAELRLTVEDERMSLEYDFDYDFKGLDKAEVRIGTFVKSVGDKWYHKGRGWPF